MSDRLPEFPGSHDPALEALVQRLDDHARAFAAERPGMADRIFVASRGELGASGPVAVIGSAPSSGAWRSASWRAVAAVVALAVSVPLVWRALTPTAVPSDVSTVRAGARMAELAPASHSEWLLVALVDDEAALHGASAWGNAGIRDADAIALTRGSSADLVTIELEELLAGEAGR